MRVRVPLTSVLLLFVCAGLCSDAAAQARASRTVEPEPAPLTERQSDARRAQLDLFVARWAGLVAQVYKVEPVTWAARLAGEFMNADAANVADAVQRPTFDGAMAALAGRGYRVDDTAAPSLPDAGLRADALSLPRLGSIGSDLVYTPLQPCRIVDTRLAGGPIAAAGSRNFIGAGEASYASQGGSATDCGLGSEVPGALALNVTAVTPNGPGYATVFTYNTSRPFAASLNYVTGAIVNNAIITKVPDPVAAADFTIYTQAQADYVVDVVGFFDTPAATPLECVNTTPVANPISANTVDIAFPSTCAAGYTAVSLSCQPESLTTMAIVLMSDSSCAVKNNDGVTRNVFASQRCCRVPGR